MVPHQRTYPKASAADPLSPADLRGVLDTHGLRFPPHAGGSDEARELHRLYRRWINQQGIRPDLAYVMPLRVLLELLLATHDAPRNERGLYAWRVLTDAINDPHGGISVLRRRYSRAA